MKYDSIEIICRKGCNIPNIGQDFFVIFHNNSNIKMGSCFVILQKYFKEMNQKLKRELHQIQFQNIELCKIYLINFQRLNQQSILELADMENSGTLQLSDDDFTGF